MRRVRPGDDLHVGDITPWGAIVTSVVRVDGVIVQAAVRGSATTEAGSAHWGIDPETLRACTMVRYW